MQKFQKKGTTELVEAVCWDGTVDESFLKWAHTGGNSVPNSGGLHVELSTQFKGTLDVPVVRQGERPEGNWEQLSVTSASPGNWIVKNDRQELCVMSGEAFKAWFEPALDHALAYQACELMVRAMIAGEDPRSVNWMDLDNVYDMSKRVLGRDRVIEIYKQERPDHLESFMSDRAANECFGPR